MKLLHDAVTIMTPFLLAALGGLFTELAGTLNIALEGFMLIGAFFSIVAAHFTGSIIAGVFLGIAATVLFSLVFGIITLSLKTNIFITGLAANLMASGLTVVLSSKFFGSKGVIPFSDIPPLPVYHSKILEALPLAGHLFSGYTPFVYISWFLLGLSWIVLYHTAFGLRIRGTGINPSAVKSLGLNPSRYKLAAVLLSGAACGLAGAMLTLNVSAFVPGITSGRGWIALVVIYLGNRTPWGILAASFIFGLSISFSNYAQGVLNLPADIILAFPYILTVGAMIVYSMYTMYRRKGDSDR